MRKFRQYKFKKIYLEEKIFELEDDEVKIGYLNINGLMEGGHAEYLNADRNLLNFIYLNIHVTFSNHTQLSRHSFILHRYFPGGWGGG